jgi:hypothetical protein
VEGRRGQRIGGVVELQRENLARGKDERTVRCRKSSYLLNSLASLKRESRTQAGPGAYCV